MLHAILKGDVSSITAKLELKLDEYFNYLNNPFVLTINYFSVPKVCNIVFSDLQFPKSYNQSIYNTTKEHKTVFIKLGSIIDDYELALNNTRRILINKTSLALLMLIYSNSFRQFCNVTETKKEILNLVKEQLDRHIKY